MEAGCIPRMCQLVIKSSNEALQLNAMWAIKNGQRLTLSEKLRTTVADPACLILSHVSKLGGL